MEERAIPSASDQRKVISSLEKAQDSIYVYCVSKDWYKKWQDFAGIPALNLYLISRGQIYRQPKAPKIIIGLCICPTPGACVAP
jgi:hypothetical protein